MDKRFKSLIYKIRTFRANSDIRLIIANNLSGNLKEFGEILKKLF